MVMKMKLTEAIEKLLKDNNKNKTWLSEKLGYARPNGVSQMLARGNITVDTLFRICESLDYEITIQPSRRAGARPSGQIVIEGKEKRE